MVNLRREVYSLVLLAAGAFCALAACGRPTDGDSALTMMLSASALKLSPGQTTSVSVQLAANVALQSPIVLSGTAEGKGALPAGMAISFAPAEVTLSGNAASETMLQLSTLPTAMDGTYSLIVTARSDRYVQSARLKVTLSGAGLGWSRQIGTSGTELLSSLAVDSAGNLYAGGQTNQGFGGYPNGGGMQYDGFIFKYKPNGEVLWTRTLSTPGSDVITAVAVDAVDNLYVAGYTYGAFPGNLPAGSADGFVAKFTTTGTRVWVRQLGTGSIDQFTALAVDPTGGVVVIGATEGGFGGAMNKGPIATSDVVVIKLTADGQQVYVVQLGTDQHERPAGVAVDATGAAYVVGSTSGAFPGQTLIGSFDTFTFKLAPDGKLAWLHEGGTAYEDHLTSALIDNKGALVTAGWTKGSFAGQIQSGGQDALILRFGADGASQLTRQFGTSYNDVLNAITMINGALYSVGTTRGVFPDQLPSGSGDIFTIRHAADGSIDWLTEFGTDQNDAGNSIAGTANELYVGGTTYGALDGLVSEGDSDGFVVQFLGAATAQGY